MFHQYYFVSPVYCSMQLMLLNSFGYESNSSQLNPYGSTFRMAAFQQCTPDFFTIHQNWHTMLFDVEANILVEKVLTGGNFEHRSKLYEYVQQHFLQLSLNKNGCRVVQMVIEAATPTELDYLLDSFTVRNIMSLVWYPVDTCVIECIFRKASNVPYRDVQVINNGFVVLLKVFIELLYASLCMVVIDMFFVRIGMLYLS